jgi:hypothetical protein
MAVAEDLSPRRDPVQSAETAFTSEITRYVIRRDFLGLCPSAPNMCRRRTLVRLRCRTSSSGRHRADLANQSARVHVTARVSKSQICLPRSPHRETTSGQHSPCLPSLNAGKDNCYRWSGDSSRRLRRVKPDRGDADVHTAHHQNSDGDRAAANIRPQNDHGNRWHLSSRHRHRAGHLSLGRC